MERLAAQVVDNSVERLTAIDALASMLIDNPHLIKPAREHLIELQKNDPEKMATIDSALGWALVHQATGVDARVSSYG